MLCVGSHHRDQTLDYSPVRIKASADGGHWVVAQRSWPGSRTASAASGDSERESDYATIKACVARGDCMFIECARHVPDGGLFVV